MGLFGGIKGKKGSGSGVYFHPGQYLVQIERCKQGKVRGKKDIGYFVAEARILESDNPRRPVGSKVAYMVQEGEYEDMFLGNVADFMRAGLSCWLTEMGQPLLKPNSDTLIDMLDEPTADDITGEKNQLMGVKIRVNCYYGMTKGKGNDFWKHEFMNPADPETPAVPSMRTLEEVAAADAAWEAEKARRKAA